MVGISVKEKKNRGPTVRKTHLAVTILHQATQKKGRHEHAVPLRSAKTNCRMARELGTLEGDGADGRQMEAEGQRERRGQEGEGSWVNPSVSSSRA